MRLIRLARRPRGPAWGALFGAAASVGLALAMLWVALGLPLPDCTFRSWTGLPCPTCGSTRLVGALLDGRPGGAFAANPIVFSGLALLALWALGSVVWRVLALPRWRVELASREQRILRLAALVTLACGWGYLIWQGT